MIVYIKKNVLNNFVFRETPLETELFNNIGITYQDYLDNKWVKLSNEQIKFYEQNPTASVKEVWNMQLTTNPLIKAKEDLEIAINLYDSSYYVNRFTINNTISAWFSAQERSNFKASIEAAKLLNIVELQFCIGENFLTIPTQKAELFLAQIQLYADKCYLVTQQHLCNVKKLNTLDEVINYDYKSNYPTLLNFEL